MTGSFARLPGGALMLDGEISLSTTEGTSFLCGFGQVVYEAMPL